MPVRKTPEPKEIDLKKESYKEKNPKEKSESKLLAFSEPVLVVLFRGLFALVPSALPSNPDDPNSPPSSVSLLFPKVIDSDTKVDDELGANHPHRPHDPNVKFQPHNLTLKYGNLSEVYTIDGGYYKFIPLVERPLPSGSEILLYDGTAIPQNEINSPSLSSNDIRREDPNKAILLYDKDEDYHLRLTDPANHKKDHVIDLGEVHSDERDSRDKGLKVKSIYLTEDYFSNEPPNEKEQLAARIFRLRRGVLAGFNGVIGIEPTVSHNTYTFEPTTYGTKPHIKEAITDTVVFETGISAGFVTIETKYGNQKFSNQYNPDSNNIICLLIEHVATEDMESPSHDYDFALTYRIADLDKVDRTKKLRRVPLITKHKALDKNSEQDLDESSNKDPGEVGKLGLPPLICGLAMYSSDSEA